ncbi:MAG: NfeD family protein [Acetatifactor sp.]|nr:NfeD family protein [Acetatifactor sp.]
MNEMIIIWLVLLIVAIVIEVPTMGLTTIWFAGGALVAILAAILNAPIWLQIILFFAVSLFLLFFTRPLAVKYFNKDRVRTNVESLVGRQAIVTGEIDNLQGIGQVTVGGQEWSARSLDDRQRIAVGNVVIVASISGVKLVVRPDEKMQDKGPVPSPVPEPMSVSQMEEMESLKPEQ